MEEGSKVIIPRSNGSESQGEIIAFLGDSAIVKFIIGDTYQGKESPSELKDKFGYKKVLVNKLRKIEE